MITRVPPGTWETLSFPSSQAAGDTAYQLQIDPRLRVRGRGTTTDATMVSPSEGNEARRNGRQGVEAESGTEAESGRVANRNRASRNSPDLAISDLSRFPLPPLPVPHYPCPKCKRDVVLYVTEDGPGISSECEEDDRPIAGDADHQPDPHGKYRINIVFRA